MNERTPRHPATIVAVGAVILSMAGCNAPAGADRAGNVATQPPALMMATPNGEPEIAPYAEVVAHASKGAVEVEILDRATTEEVAGLTGEEILDAVRNGDVQLAALPVRDLADLGVHGLDALIAPYAIDSLELEGELLRDADLVASMVGELDGLGVTGVGILPGPLQYVHAMTFDLTTPEDFADAAIAVSSGEVASATMSALGAIPTVAEFNRQDVSEFDGLVLHIPGVVGNSYHELGGSITVDAPIWPRPFVVIANRDRFAALSDVEQEALRTATVDSIDEVLAAHDARTAEAVSVICQSGLLRFVETGPEGLDELRRAVEPVVEGIRSDALGAAILDRIQDLHSQEIEAATPACPLTPADWPTEVSDRLDGTYTGDTTAEDLRAQGKPERDVVEENWGHYVLVVQDGRYAITQENGAECTWVYGQWRMDDEWVRQTVGGGGGPSTHGTLNRPGEDFLFRWTEFDGTLHLTMPITDGPPDQPWTRVSTTPDLTAFPERCPPPPQAFSSD